MAANTHAPAAMMISIIIDAVKMMVEIINLTPQAGSERAAPNLADDPPCATARLTEINTFPPPDTPTARQGPNSINFYKQEKKYR
ncbi:hypothetical protein HX882_23030 [Pseudomonas gingeri]|uniref:Uncharacterized protein n=1 Tax=Pseudomonas gingeri TaxID=117681 RepID=A0A7Y7XHA7_9PSED|nr:hypothetical protein [Pseudomonas gingeri]NWB98772.1 hypothetical protein [Pseudomonas gingeri]